MLLATFLLWSGMTLSQPIPDLQTFPALRGAARIKNANNIRETSPCPPLSLAGVRIAYVTASRAMININYDFPGGTYPAYRFEWKKQGTVRWELSQVTGHFIELTGLSHSAVYEYRVSGRCAKGWSPVSETGTFRTLGIFYGSTSALSTGENQAEVDKPSIPIVLKPTPGSGDFYLTGELAGGTQVDVQVCDLSGRMLVQIDLGWRSVLSETLDLHMLQPGMYVLAVQTGQGLWSEKIIIR